MKKLLFALVIFASFSALAGGSIFHHKSHSRNSNGVDSISAYVCGSLKCHDVVIKEGSCDGIEHASMQYGVCMCDEGYKVKDFECVKDDGSECSTVGSCPSEKFCNFGGPKTPNTCQKLRSEEFEYDGIKYYYNNEFDLSSWCRSTEGTNDCSYGYLTYYGAYDWCETQGARLLTSEEVQSLPTQWLSKLPWHSNQTSYWLDDGRLTKEGEVISLGDTTGYKGAGGVVCVKDLTVNSGTEVTENQWIPLQGCDCTDKGVSSDSSDKLCDIQCCMDRYGKNSYTVNHVCCKMDDYDCICAANGCKTGSKTSPLDDFCCAKAQGLI